MDAPLRAEHCTRLRQPLPTPHMSCSCHQPQVSWLWDLGTVKRGFFFPPRGEKKKKHSKEVQGKKYMELVTRLKQSKKHLVLIKSHLMDCFFPQLYFNGVIRIIQVDTNPSETISVLP